MQTHFSLIEKASNNSCELQSRQTDWPATDSAREQPGTDEHIPPASQLFGGQFLQSF